MYPFFYLLYLLTYFSQTNYKLMGLQKRTKEGKQPQAYPHRADGTGLFPLPWPNIPKLTPKWQRLSHKNKTTGPTRKRNRKRQQKITFCYSAAAAAEERIKHRPFEISYVVLLFVGLVFVLFFVFCYPLDNKEQTNKQTEERVVGY